MALRLKFAVILFSGVMAAVTFTDAKTLKIQSETSKSSYPLHYRSNALDHKVIWLHKNEVLAFNLCLIRKTNVSVTNVRFSNDGGSDVCSVLINGNDMGQFASTAKSDYGHLWDVFHSSNGLGNAIEMEAGWNTVDLKVLSADNYGIEIDYLEFSVDDEEVNDDIFSCRLPCITDLPTVSTAGAGLTTGKAVQRSYPTQCAEEDNVNVAVFNKNVKKYEITASSPKYRLFYNNKSEDTQNCPFLTPIYWLYENFHVAPDTKTLSSNNSHLYFGQKSAPNPYIITKMAVTFTLQGRKKGHIDSNIGSTLYMTLQSPDAPSDVTVSYIHRNGTTISFNPVTFSSSLTNYTWHVPDFTWLEDLGNHVIVTVKSTSDNQQMTNFRLERRYMSADQVIQLYSAGGIIVEAIRSDFWWQAPENMQLKRPSTGEVWDNVAYFRIYKSLPWSGGFSQIFVLYQDGNMRLLNPTPQGLDWIPFGTSVILGQTKVDDFRPAVSIATVEIEPETMLMKVIYLDGSSARLNLQPALTETKLLVSDMDFKKDTETHPFATFRSMYVQAGNCDSDSIVSDKSVTKKILGGSWTEVTGTTFLVYRRCESKHLTQSPDIKLKVTET